MRLTTDFFTSALVRRVREQGGFAYLVRRGAIEAGSLFILHHRLHGQVDLYGPAPQNFYNEIDKLEGRLFIRHLHACSSEEAQLFLEKELKFDPDIWLIEIDNLGTEITTIVSLVEQ